jgi:hypothetical protein
MADEFLQTVRKSNGFYAANSQLPAGASADGNYTQDNDQTNPIVFNEVRLKLESIWKTEYHCPELLPYPTETVNDLKEALDGQQVNSSNNSSSFSVISFSFQKGLH